MKRKCLSIVFFLACFMGGSELVLAQQDTTEKFVQHKFNPSYKKQEPISQTPSKQSIPTTTQPITPANAPSPGIPTSVQPANKNNSNTKPQN